MAQPNGEPRDQDDMAAEWAAMAGMSGDADPRDLASDIASDWAAALRGSVLPSGAASPGAADPE